MAGEFAQSIERCDEKSGVNTSRKSSEGQRVMVVIPCSFSIVSLFFEVLRSQVQFAIALGCFRFGSTYLTPLHLRGMYPGIKHQANAWFIYVYIIVYSHSATLNKYNSFHMSLVWGVAFPTMQTYDFRCSIPIQNTLEAHDIPMVDSS